MTSRGQLANIRERSLQAEKTAGAKAYGDKCGFRPSHTVWSEQRSKEQQRDMQTGFLSQESHCGVWFREQSHDLVFILEEKWKWGDQLDAVTTLQVRDEGSGLRGQRRREKLMDCSCVWQTVFLTTELFHVVLRLLVKQSKGGKYSNRNTKSTTRTISQRNVSSRSERKTLTHLYYSIPGPGSWNYSLSICWINEAALWRFREKIS